MDVAIKRLRHIDFGTGILPPIAKMVDFNLQGHSGLATHIGAHACLSQCSASEEQRFAIFVTIAEW